MLKDQKEDYDLYILVKKDIYNNANKYFINECNRIYKEIYNCYYSYRQMILYMIYRYIVDGKVPCMNKIKHTNIKEMMRLFTKKQHKEDKKFVAQVIEKTNVSGQKEIIKSIAFLTKEKYISPMFFLYILRKKVLTECNEHVIFTGEDLEKFLFTMKKLNSIYTEVLNEQEKVRDRLGQSYQED